MLRRPHQGASQPTSTSTHRSMKSSLRSSMQNHPKEHRRRMDRRRIAGLLAVAAGITVMTYVIFPEQVSKAETEAVREMETVSDWWHHYEKHADGQVPPVPIEEHPDFKGTATERMEAQSSSWVEGEKRLKQKLKVLFEMQLKGENIGVPVLTRYLGEDIPAWPEKGQEEEWQKKVDRKYAEMRREEEEWKAKISAMLDKTKG